MVIKNKLELGFKKKQMLNTYLFLYLKTKLIQIILIKLLFKLKS